MSGHSVSTDRKKIIRPMVLGSASRNGHRERAPEVITENASDSIGSPLLPGRTARPTVQGTIAMPRRQRPAMARQRRVFPTGRWVQRIRGVRT